MIIFILVYLLSFAIHLLMEYKENKMYIHTIGDLMDNIRFYMWFPLLNTLIIVVTSVVILIIKLWELSKISVLWEKFRNIKLR
jgi:hypothetical protein